MAKLRKKILRKVLKKIRPLKRRALAKKKIKKNIAKKSKTKKIQKKIVVKKNKTVAKKNKKIVKKIKPVASLANHKKSRLPRRLVAPRNDEKIGRKARNDKTVPDFPAEALFKARIKVIGIGGGGGSIVSEIGRSLEKANFVIADTDIRALKKKSGIKYFWFGEEFTHGLGTGVNVDLAKQAAESAKEKISQNFREQDIIIFIASLGGGLGSGATQVFVDAARDFGGITFGIFTMPFKFEGKNKYRIAQNALKSLRQSLNVSLVIPNEKIFKIIDANTPITDAFSIVNKSLIESLESLIDLIYNPGIINIDFADLRTILKGRGNTAFLNTVEESGKNRADKICESVLLNPLLQNNNFKAEKILFNIAGSENLSMFEVEKVSSHISKSNPEAKIIFGISKSAKLKNKIKTTILMTGERVPENLPEKKPEAIKPEVVEAVKKKVLVKKPARNVSHSDAGEGKSKKPGKKVKKEEKNKKPQEKSVPAGGSGVVRDEKQISVVPVFKIPVPSAPVLNQSKLKVIEEESELSKRGIRRSGLEIKKAEEQEEKKRLAQEKEWEIPAFLRRVKYKN